MMHYGIRDFKLYTISQDIPNEIWWSVENDTRGWPAISDVTRIMGGAKRLKVIKISNYSE